MKPGTFFISIWIVSVFILCNACAKQRTKWQGRIEQKDGITVVRNPKEPMYGQEACIVEEDLSIGNAEGGRGHTFSEIRDIAVDEEENIYILDFKEAHIMVFNKAGEYLRTIGKRGQGPGEAQRPTGIYITPRNEILLNDRGAGFLRFFTLTGEYIRSISLARFPFFSRPKVDTQNNIVARYTIITGPRNVWTFVLAKFDSELNELFTIFSYEYDITPNIYNVYPPQCFWDIRSDDSVVWGYANRYELQILGKSGPIRKIIKDSEPVEITKEEKKEWLEFAFGDKGVPPDVKVNWNKYHNAFQSLNIDDLAKIFVQTYEKAIDGRGYNYDVFDSEGIYIAKILLKAPPRVLKKNKLYTIEEDEEGYQIVKRYKVTWKT